MLHLHPLFHLMAFTHLMLHLHPLFHLMAFTHFMLGAFLHLVRHLHPLFHFHAFLHLMAFAHLVLFRGGLGSHNRRGRLHRGHSLGHHLVPLASVFFTRCAVR